LPSCVTASTTLGAGFFKPLANEASASERVFSSLKAGLLTLDRSIPSSALTKRLAHAWSHHALLGRYVSRDQDHSETVEIVSKTGQLSQQFGQFRFQGFSSEFVSLSHIPTGRNAQSVDSIIVDHIPIATASKGVPDGGQIVGALKEFRKGASVSPMMRRLERNVCKSHGELPLSSTSRELPEDQISFFPRRFMHQARVDQIPKDLGIVPSCCNSAEEFI
jgi:hypothetical protein